MPRSYKTLTITAVLAFILTLLAQPIHAANHAISTKAQEIYNTNCIKTHSSTNTTGCQLFAEFQKANKNFNELKKFVSLQAPAFASE